MNAVEILLIIACVLIVGSFFINYFYKKAKGIHTSGCDCSSSRNLLKEYNKKYHKRGKCCCNKNNCK